MATTAELQAYARQAATKAGVPPDLFVAQISQESSWNPNAANGSAYGLAQVQAATAANPGYGVQPLSDPSNPYQSIDFAASYDAALYKQTGSWSQTMQRYGTLPGSGSYTGGQTAVAAAAKTADNDQLNSDVANAINPNSPNTGNDPAYNHAATAATAGSGGNEWTGSNGIVAGLVSGLWEISSRIGVVLIGLCILVLALAAILFHSKHSIIPVPA